MSNNQWDEIGDFKDEHDAKEWAERNGVDFRDLHTKNRGEGRVTASVRRSALGDQAEGDLTYGRRTGFFR